MRRIWVGFSLPTMTCKTMVGRENSVSPWFSQYVPQTPVWSPSLLQEVCKVQIIFRIMLSYRMLFLFPLIKKIKKISLLRNYSYPHFPLFLCPILLTLTSHIQSSHPLCLCLWGLYACSLVVLPLLCPILYASFHCVAPWHGGAKAVAG